MSINIATNFDDLSCLSDRCGTHDTTCLCTLNDSDKNDGFNNPSDSSNLSNLSNLNNITNKTVETIETEKQKFKFGKVNKIKLLILENSVGLMHIGLFIFLYFSNFSYVSWGVFSLSKNYNVSNECSQIWFYDFVGIIYAITYVIIGGYTFAITLRSARTMSDMTKINDSTFLDYIFLTILMFWGLKIMCTISDQCVNVYLSGHKDIWDLCQGTFYGILSMTLLFIILKFFIIIKKLYNYALWNTKNITTENKNKMNIFNIFNIFNFSKMEDDQNYVLLQNNYD